jgi:hypothetical protein
MACAPDIIPATTVEHSCGALANWSQLAPPAPWPRADIARHNAVAHAQALPFDCASALDHAPVTTIVVARIAELGRTRRWCMKRCISRHPRGVGRLPDGVHPASCDRAQDDLPTAGISRPYRGYTGSSTRFSMRGSGTNQIIATIA